MYKQTFLLKRSKLVHFIKYEDILDILHVDGMKRMFLETIYSVLG